MKPFYFFADLIDYYLQGSKGREVRRTVVVKINDESQELALINLKRFYKAAFCTRGEDKNNLIPATEEDWEEFQASIRPKVNDDPYLVNPISLKKPQESKLPDIAGMKFADDMLTAIRKLPAAWSNPSKDGRIKKIDMWEFMCHYCGTLKPIRRSRVTGGYQKSCGCIKKDISKQNMVKANAAREKTCS